MKELDIRDLITIFWNKKIQIGIIIAVFIAIGIIYTMFFTIPKYTASTTLVLAKQETDANANNSITQTEITLNQKLISTYSELIKSKAVLRQVLTNLNMSDFSEETLRKNVSVTAVKDTELIKIAVTGINKESVDKLANEISKVFTEKVLEIYSINNVHIVDTAEKANNPYNINHVKDIAIFIAVGLIIAIGYVLVNNLLDNTIENAEQVEKETGLTVLATVPEYDFDINIRMKGII